MVSLAYRLHRLNRLSFFACVHYESWRNGAGYSDQPEVRTQSIWKLSVVDSRAWFLPSRKRKMVSSPPSLKRTQTSKVLGEKGFEILGEMDYCWSLFSWNCGVFSVHPKCPTNQSKYNKVVQFYGEQQFTFAFYLKLNVNPKTEKQVMGKLNFKHSRQGTLENLFYGLWPRQKY